VANVVSRVDGVHSLHPGGGRRVDRRYAGVGVRTANERHMEHPRQLDVIHVPTPSLHEGGILPTPDRPSEDASGGGHAVTSSCSQSGGAGSSPRILAAAYSIARTML